MIESINKFKGILLFPVLCFTFFMCGTVSAETVPTTIGIDDATTAPADYLHYIQSNDGSVENQIKTPMQFVDVNGNARAAYCFEKVDLPYNPGSYAPNVYVLNKLEQVTDVGYIYILVNGYPNNSFGKSEKEAYYITQIALYWYQDLASNKSDSIDGVLPAKFKSDMANNYSDPNGLYSHIKTLAHGAKNAKKQSATISLSGGTMTYASDYKSFNGTVSVSTNGTLGTTTVSDIKNLDASLIKKTISGNKINFNVPVSAIQNNSLTASFKLTASANKNITNAYLYKTSVSPSVSSSECEKVVDRTTGNKRCQEFQEMLVPFTATDTQSANITLNITRTKVQIKKVDENGNGVSGAKLKLLYNGSLIESWTSTTGAKTFWDIPEGNLTLVEETAPVGFIKASNKTIKIVRNGTMQSETMVNKKTKIQVLKTDEKGSPIAGAKMKLTDSEGNVHTWTTTTKAYALSGVAIGKCTIEEIEAPSGYVLDTKKQSCEIKNVETVQTFTFKNTKNQVEISKQDATTGKELPGATLVLKTAAGKEIDKWVSSDKPHVITGLAKGMYVLEETIAPEGYIKSTEKVMFQINEKGLVEDKVVMKNQPTKIIVSKKDSKDKKTLLEGAKLQLKNSKGEVIATWTTTKEAYTIEKLVVGETYTLEELVAPTGYDKAKPVTFKVEEKESQEIVMYDSLTVIDVPSTDSFTSMLIYIIGGLLITAGIVGTMLYINNIKKRRSV